VAFGVAALAGAYLVWAGGWPILLAGLAAILAGIGYSVGPSPLAYNGLADLMVMIFFGFVAVCGTVYVQAGTQYTFRPEPFPAPPGWRPWVWGAQS